MENLRKYLVMLDNLEDFMEDLPMLDFDTEIENFYENVLELLENHREIMQARLNKKEKELLKRGV